MLRLGIAGAARCCRSSLLVVGLSGGSAQPRAAPADAGRDMPARSARSRSRPADRSGSGSYDKTVKILGRRQRQTVAHARPATPKQCPRSLCTQRQAHRLRQLRPFHRGLGHRHRPSAAHAALRSDLCVGGAARRAVDRDRTDGTRVAAASADSTVKVWNITRPATCSHPDTDTPMWSPRSPSFRTARRRFRSKDGTVRIWDAATGRIRRRSDHGGPVLSVAVSPDGKRIAAAASAVRSSSGPQPVSSS